LVFETRDQTQSWDGTSGNQPVPEGIYPYRLQYTAAPTGRRLQGEQTGVIHILR
jgi:hypothetical protein